MEGRKRGIKAKGRKEMEERGGPQFMYLATATAPS